MQRTLKLTTTNRKKKYNTYKKYTFAAKRKVRSEECLSADFLHPFLNTTPNNETHVAETF